MRKAIVFIALAFTSIGCFSGKLFTFDKNAVLLNVLSQIQLRYSDLAKMELHPGPVQTRISKAGELEAYVHFRYKAENNMGVLFACAKVDEDGKLIAINRDIKGRRGLANLVLPESFGCYGDP